MSEVAETAQAGRRFRGLALGVVVVALAVFVAFAALRETRKASSVMAPQPAAGGMGQVDRPAMSADEERYANGLWQIHDQVRMAALKMTFAGLSYKMGDAKKETISEKVLPLTTIFKDAEAKSRKMPVPSSMKGLHLDYLAALSLYQEAAVEMMRNKKAGDDQHLITAQEMSEKASNLLLKVGDTLWPGEHKPN